MLQIDLGDQQTSVIFASEWKDERDGELTEIPLVHKWDQSDSPLKWKDRGAKRILADFLAHDLFRKWVDEGGWKLVDLGPASPVKQRARAVQDVQNLSRRRVLLNRARMAVRSCLPGKKPCTKLDCELTIDVHRQRPSPTYFRLFDIFDEGNKATLEGPRRGLAEQLPLFRQEPIAQFAHRQAWHLPSRKWSLTCIAGTFKRTILDLDKQPPKVRRSLGCIGTEHFAELPPLMTAPSDNLLAPLPDVNLLAADRLVIMLAEQF